MELRLKLTTVIQEVPEGGYVGFIEELPGINTQGETLEEVKVNLLDALELSNPYLRLDI
jgi:predicted RNase H-like HicB family nuclease